MTVIVVVILVFPDRLETAQTRGFRGDRPCDYDRCRAPPYAAVHSTMVVYSRRCGFACSSLSRKSTAPQVQDASIEPPTHQPDRERLGTSPRD